jgi:hypothetical protein
LLSTRPTFWVRAVWSRSLVSAAVWVPSLIVSGSLSGPVAPVAPAGGGR